MLVKFKYRLIQLNHHFRSLIKLLLFIDIIKPILKPLRKSIENQSANKNVFIKLHGHQLEIPNDHIYASKRSLSYDFPLKIIANSSKGKLVIDVGANVGDTTILF